MNNSQLQAIYSDRVADCPSADCKHGHRQRKVLKHFKGRDLRILDVGCADGSFLAPLIEEHALWGIDVSESMARLAYKKGYCGAQKASIEDPTTFPDGTFDAAFCGECIEHIVDTDFALSEMNRVLRDGGMLVLTFPNVRTPISFAAMLFNRAPMFAARYRSGHVRDFTTASMRQALEANGFRVDNMEGVDFCISSSPVGVLPRLASWLPSWASTVVVRATKVAEAKYEVRSHL